MGPLGESAAGMIGWRPSEEMVREAMESEDLASLIDKADTALIMIASSAMVDGLENGGNLSEETSEKIGVGLALIRLVANWAAVAGLEATHAAMDKVVEVRMSENGVD